MKNIIRLFLFMALFSACDNRSCDEVICGVNQVCNRGFCVCLDGFEGADCQTLASEKYIGNFNVSQSCSQGSGGNFISFGTVGADGSPVNELLFYNFLGTGFTAYAYIGTDQNGDGNYLRFPTQNLGASEIAGEGFYQDFGGSGRFSLDIQLTTNTQVSLCNYNYF